MSEIYALLIDDNQDNLNVLAQLLSKEGVQSIKIEHPNKLPSLLESLGQIDVVFLDLEMQGKDGFQIRDALRSNPHFNGVPIVAYTVHVSEIDTVYQHGFDGFLGKPLDATRFPEQLGRILNGESVWERA